MLTIMPQNVGKTVGIEVARSDDLELRGSHRQRLPRDSISAVHQPNRVVPLFLRTPEQILMAVAIEICRCNNVPSAIDVVGNPAIGDEIRRFQKPNRNLVSHGVLPNDIGMTIRVERLRGERKAKGEGY